MLVKLNSYLLELTHPVGSHVTLLQSSLEILADLGNLDQSSDMVEEAVNAPFRHSDKPLASRFMSRALIVDAVAAAVRDGCVFALFRRVLPRSGSVRLPAFLDILLQSFQGTVYLVEIGEVPHLLAYSIKGCGKHTDCGQKLLGCCASLGDQMVPVIIYPCAKFMATFQPFLRFTAIYRI